FTLARELCDICSRFDAPLFVNDRIDVALAADASGVHLPSDSIDVADARKLLGPKRMIDVSTHTLEEVERAASGGADFVVFGPIFEPLSKSGYGPPLGADALRSVCRRTSIPVFALGGITPERISELAD